MYEAKSFFKNIIIVAKNHYGNPFYIAPPHLAIFGTRYRNEQIKKFKN